MSNKIKILGRSLRESGFGAYFLKVLTEVGIILALPLSLPSKLFIFFAMNFFILLASVILYLVLDDRYLSTPLIINFLTLGLTVNALLFFISYVVSIVGALNIPAAELHAAVSQLTIFTILSIIISHITSWMFLRVAYEGGNESEVEGFPTLYKGVNIALAILLIVIITIALSRR